MAIPTTLVGTWEEIKTHDAELSGHRVTVSVHPFETTKEERLERFRQSLEMIRELGKDLPTYPERIFTSEDYYPDED